MRTKSWTPGASGREIRMYDKDDVELALLAVEEGMSRREAAELVGCGETAVGNWLAGRLPHSCLPSARIQREGRTRGARMCPRGVYDPPTTGPLAGLEPAQIENILLRAVLADLKAGGWEPGIWDWQITGMQSPAITTMPSRILHHR